MIYRDGQRGPDEIGTLATIHDVVNEFREMGCVTFSINDEAGLFDEITKILKDHNVTTYTSIDFDHDTVTISRHPMKAPKSA